MRISKKYNIHVSQYELDFVDVNLEEDIQLFLDPYFISRTDTKFSIEAQLTLKSFFENILDLLDENKEAEVYQIFNKVGEMEAIRFGFAKKSTQGAGAGTHKSSLIIENLKKSRAMKTKIFEDIEDVTLFVSGVGKDVMSDMVGNIIKRQLVDYTQKQCKLWNIPMEEDINCGYYWNRNEKKWMKEHFTLPTHKTIPILMVPKRLVSFSEKYVHGEFLQKYILYYEQQEQLKLHNEKIPKEELKKNFSKPYKDEITKYLSESNIYLLAQFKAKTIQSMKPISNQEILKKSGREIEKDDSRKLVIEKLINELNYTA